MVTSRWCAEYYAAISREAIPTLLWRIPSCCDVLGISIFLYSGSSCPSYIGCMWISISLKKNYFSAYSCVSSQHKVQRFFFGPMFWLVCVPRTVNFLKVFYSPLGRTTFCFCCWPELLWPNPLLNPRTIVEGESCDVIFILCLIFGLGGRGGEVYVWFSMTPIPCKPKIFSVFCCSYAGWWWQKSQNSPTLLTARQWW